MIPIETSDWFEEYKMVDNLLWSLSSSDMETFLYLRLEARLK